jgi:GntR family transcriptional regulator of vanillate catabolism
MKPSTTSRDVADALRERILVGQIAPGTKLHQTPLSDEMGFSRTPVREALANLTKEGLLEYRPNRGYSVRAFSLAEVVAAFEVRARLEALACSLCARRGLSKATLDRLWGYVRSGDEILASGRLDPADLVPYRKMNVEFHDTIIGPSENHWLREFVRQTHNVPLASDRIILWNDYHIIKRSHDDHRRITEAIAERDAARADYLMTEHVTFAGQVLRNHLSEVSEGQRLFPDGVPRDETDKP